MSDAFALRGRKTNVTKLSWWHVLGVLVLNFCIHTPVTDAADIVTSRGVVTGIRDVLVNGERFEMIPPRRLRDRFTNLPELVAAAVPSE